MAKPPPPDPKQQSLRAQGVLHDRAEAVTDALFEQFDFFDPRDLLQVNYEMLRRVETDGYSVSAATAAFGLSRPSFYEARAAWQRAGLVGLLPKKRGPHGGHKLTPEVVAFVCGLYGEAAAPTPRELAAQVEAHFGVRVHPRSIERALQRAEKNADAIPCRDTAHGGDGEHLRAITQRLPRGSPPPRWRARPERAPASRYARGSIPHASLRRCTRTSLT